MRDIVTAGLMIEGKVDLRVVIFQPMVLLQFLLSICWREELSYPAHDQKLVDLDEQQSPDLTR